jgi:hypothetical protein
LNLTNGARSNYNALTVALNQWMSNGGIVAGGAGAAAPDYFLRFKWQTEEHE